MAIVHFKKDLIKIAKQIIESESTADKIKAFTDVGQINYYLNKYQNNLCFDINAANELDDRLYREYNCIQLIDSLGTMQTSNNISFSNVQNPYSPSDDVIVRLNRDLYGILCEVLMKEGTVKVIQECVERVE